MKLLIETNAFDAHETHDGIVIQQKKQAAIKIGVLIILISALAFALYYFVPFHNYRKKWIQWVFDPALHYLSYVTAITGVFLVLKGILVKNIKPIVFNQHTKELLLRREKIPFREIENLRYFAFPFIGGNLTSIKFKYKGLTRSLMNVPAIVKNTSDMDRFINDIVTLVKNSES